MAIILPELGLFFWATVIFLLFFFILRRYAWNPITNALKQREYHIEQSLKEAKLAREEMEKLKADNEALIRGARIEADQILTKAREVGEQIIKEKRDEAATKAAEDLAKAKVEIESQKRAAIAEIKDTTANLAVEVAEKILRKQLADQTAQVSYAKEIIADLSNN